MNAQLRDRFWDAVLGELNLAFVQGRDGGCVSTNIDAADRLAALAAPKEAGAIVLVSLDDSPRRLAHMTWCSDEGESLLSAVRKAMFYGDVSDLGDDHEREAREVRDELLECGEWYPEGDPPLYLFRVANPPGDQRREGGNPCVECGAEHGERCFPNCCLASPPPEAAAAVLPAIELLIAARNMAQQGFAHSPVASRINDALDILHALASPTGVDDSARLDWLERVGFSTRNREGREIVANVHSWLDDDGNWKWTAAYVGSQFPTARAAIDAALAARDGSA